MTAAGTASRSSPRTLAEDLRSRDDASLRSLLMARPDLGRPAPADCTSLAARAASLASVSLAVESLDLWHLSVLSAIAADEKATLSRIRRSVAANCGTVDAAVGALRELALVWGPDASLHVVRSVADVLPLSRLTTTIVGDRPPALSRADAVAAAVDSAAAGSAFDIVRHLETVLDAWAADPPAVLRSGGVGVRDVRSAAAIAGIDQRRAGFLVELGYVAGLVDRSRDVGLEEVWLPTPRFDGWAGQPVAWRWERLGSAWLGTHRTAALVGIQDNRGRTTNALASGLEQRTAPLLRRLTLQALATIRPGRPEDEQEIRAWVAWHHPRRTRLRDLVIEHTLSEAGWLGVTGLGALAKHGADLLAGNDAAATLSPLVPPAVDHVLLQADLSAVAPGPLQRTVATRMALVADVESRGGATVYRFTAASVRRAFDAGWSADRVHGFIEQHSRTPVPQPLRYLIADIARKHGRLRVGTAAGYVHSDEPSEIDALVADRELTGLRLRRIAPTVAVADAAPAVLLAALRQSGHAPVTDDSLDSSARTPLTKPKRAGTARGHRTESWSGALKATEAAEVLRAVRAGDRAAARRPDDGATVDMLTALRDAVQDAGSVWLAYMDQAGSLSERIVDPVRVDAGWLTAHDHRTDRTRNFALHRIRQVSSLP